MKKVIISIILLCVIVFFVTTFWDYIPEIPSRLAPYHNMGEINLVVDGKKENIDGQKVSYYSDSNEIVETYNIKEGKFKFKDGLYGFNTFEFSYKDILELEFGQFNTNWWHVVNYKIDIEVTTEKNICKVKQTSKIGKYEKVIQKDLDMSAEKKISLFK